VVADEWQVAAKWQNMAFLRQKVYIEVLITQKKLFPEQETPFSI
jgi:hypothetical protein